MWKNEAEGVGGQSKGVWSHATHFHLSNKDFQCPFHGHLRNIQ